MRVPIFREGPLEMNGTIFDSEINVQTDKKIQSVQSSANRRIGERTFWQRRMHFRMVVRRRPSQGSRAI